jgi:predicted secreted protein
VIGSKKEGMMMCFITWLKSKFAGAGKKGNANVAKALTPDANSEALALAKQLSGQGVSVRIVNPKDNVPEMEVGKDPL